ncbi:MAG TPA: GIY-YIG nuclease family protein [Candidatus Paceibacterota bacterium]|nr:GIY-YIG nuclease family protein [Candidatus Paceibacterota bacterium]
MQYTQCMWYVYIIKCKDDTLYTGISTNLERRFREHLSDKHSAKYTRTHGVKKMFHVSYALTRSEAQKEEARIKKLSRKQKEILIRDLVAVRES